MNTSVIKLILPVLLLAAVVAGCGSSGGSAGDADIGAGDKIPVSDGADSASDSVGHVHGIGRNPSDGVVYIATHQGLWKLQDGEDPARVGDYLHDFMGFAVVGDDHFIASGHPNSAPSMPPHMGLIESTDAGKTWTNRSLIGEADFHALRSVNGTAFGWNSQDSALMVSSDLREWETAADGIMMVDFAVEPEQQQQVIVASVPRDQTTLEVQRSTDGGSTFKRVDDAPQLVRFAWSTQPELWGFAVDGTVWLSADDGVTWKKTGQLDAVPDAVSSSDDGILAAANGAVMQSEDGSDWRKIHGYEV